MATKEIESNLLCKRLIHHFYSRNHNFCLEPKDIEEMNWDWQKEFLDSTFNSKLIQKYPLSGQFSRLFLKKLIQHLEPHQEVHDDFYAQLCTAMNIINKDGFSYQHYLVENDINNIITIKETRNMVVNGTTGLKTWEAALMLSDWALAKQEIFSEKNVLELGSGVGFTGITIGKLCDIKSLMFTDCHDDVLKTICENVKINFPDFVQEETQDVTSYKSENKCLSIMKLDWNSVDNLPDNIVPDILIGADIVYDPSILVPLCNVIQTFCKRNSNLVVYIASVIRNEATFASFLKTLDDAQLQYERVEVKKSGYIEWDDCINKCLLKIIEKST
ncbi:protein-lysine N-methyltransferase EEF2KMT-like isoform X2 [Trichoplusia ni]|uniref:Protein-lysine N-methyltransferase EEF2KMT-like isoform X2 n=1 Tax=Trichoplusia ni TaxID=7111 RepID=A0A7E5V8I3_TRINI|nr:protein-lysine N-methyltransferase EEF2KMT-like isoform X2 [Trichoplusia ni]